MGRDPVVRVRVNVADVQKINRTVQDGPLFDALANAFCDGPARSQRTVELPAAAVERLAALPMKVVPAPFRPIIVAWEEGALAEWLMAVGMADGPPLKAVEVDARAKVVRATWETHEDVAGPGGEIAVPQAPAAGSPAC